MSTVGSVTLENRMRQWQAVVGKCIVIVHAFVEDQMVHSRIPRRVCALHLSLWPTQNRQTTVNYYLREKQYSQWFAAVSFVAEPLE